MLMNESRSIELILEWRFLIIPETDKQGFFMVGEVAYRAEPTFSGISPPIQPNSLREN
jgi:hypothetical protein